MGRVANGEDRWTGRGATFRCLGMDRRKSLHAVPPVDVPLGGLANHRIAPAANRSGELLGAFRPPATRLVRLGPSSMLEHGVDDGPRGLDHVFVAKERAVACHCIA